MKRLITLLSIFISLMILPQPSMAFNETEAAQEFAIALKKGEEITTLIEKFKKIPTGPLRQWANNLAVEVLGKEWLALVKPSSKK